ncbi:MAG: peptidoglycan DD-metalloendopeptidase family protein [Cyclobacteriaceae bacterium]|jgi:murein DD-endopeptidase MepM/ murein hydrolase activator NlpD|nr:peptidoglycan DD-metalloendopeptidase family protein [Cyclobacteriaceae bacterium]
MRKLILATLILITGLVLFGIRENVDSFLVDSLDSLVYDFQLKEPTFLYGMVVDDHLIVEDRVKRNQYLSDILRSHNVPVHLINQLTTLPRDIFDVRRIVPNKKYTLIYPPDSASMPKAFVYEPNAIDYVVLWFGDKLSVDACQREVTVVEKTISGVINSSLSQTINEMGISHELTNKFVDIFAWQVDFQRLQRGDQFKLIYEELQVEEQTIGIRQIKGIYFNHFGNGYYAIPYDQGNGLDYFDEEGKSLRKALLKYPIEFTRISSRYSGSRFHPVLKVNKAHLGTDFAAPTGTPIRSVGDGVVEEAQFKSNNGNYVKIRHNATYTTQYLHMSKIAPGIKPGVRVRQGQWIGNVGSTGLATGPHVCYRFWKNGVQVDALRVELPPSEPILDSHKEEYARQRDEVIRQLQQIPSRFADSFASR